MTQEPQPGPSSTWLGLLHALRPLLICWALFWFTPLEVTALMRLLDHPPAY